MGDDRPATYVETREDGSTQRVWRASALGMCEGYLVRVALGMTPDAPPEMLTDAWKEGVDNEASVIAKVDEYGWKVLGVDSPLLGTFGGVDETGQLSLELAVPGGVIRCHPDGIAIKTDKWPLVEEGRLGDTRVIEAKFIQPEGKKGEEGVERIIAKPMYAWQLSVEMACTGLRGLYVCGWKDAKKDREINDDIVVPAKMIGWDRLLVDTAPYTVGQIKARVARLNKMIKDAEDTGVMPGCDWAMFPCGFWQEHDTETGVWAKKEREKLRVPMEVDEELRKLALEASTAQSIIKTRERQKKQATARALELMREHNIEPDTYDLGGWECTYVKGKREGYVKEAYEVEYVTFKVKKDKGE